MSERKTVVGTCAGIVEKPTGWFEVQVLVPGNQYPMRLDTKKEELIEAARGVGSSIATWTYNESESDKVNPHNNKPYINRYFEEVELGALGPDEGSGSGQISPDPEKMSKEDWALKDSAIHHMAAVKAAADALKHTIPSEPSEDDLNRFVGNVLLVARQWHSVVLATREDPADDDIPF